MDTRKRYILLVEDSPEDVVLIVRALKQVAPDCETIVVGDAGHAMELLHSGEVMRGGPPVLALVDIGLPRVGGFELVEQLRADHTTQDLPVFILSSSDHPLDKSLGLKVGVDGYILKPVSFNELVASFESLGSYLW